MNNQEIIERLKARNVGMFHTYNDFNEVLKYLDSWNDPTATQAALFTLNACDKEMIRALTPEPGTVTVTMTAEQADALNDFAEKGCDEWIYDRENCAEVFTEEEITDRNEQMDLCDQAQLILTKALQEQTNE